jgi:DNA-binding GntR family transcriptional regulator
MQRRRKRKRKVVRSGDPRLRRQIAYEAIRAAILSGTFAPGETLAEVGLAARFETSRTPVREALMRLQEEGLVAIIPRRGPVVRLLAPNEMYDTLLVREALEALAARIAATRISVSRLKELRTEWEELGRTLSEATLETIFQRSNEFHAAIIAASENETLRRLLGSIRGRIDISRQLYLKPQGTLTRQRAELSCREHLRIIEALEAGDAERSEALMHEHLRDLTAEIIGAAAHREKGRLG